MSFTSTDAMDLVVDISVKNLNDFLSKNYLQGTTCFVPSHILGASFAVRGKVQSVFETAGWEVKYYDNQRDGSYYTFSGK